MNLNSKYYASLDGLCYFSLVSIAHLFSEFIFVSIYQIANLKWRSFFVNYSCAYLFAFIISSAEYVIELYLGYVPSHTEIVAGMVILFFGFTFRIGTFAFAGKNFNYDFQEYKKPEKLVTRGLFSISRFPGYLGWFLLIIGGQVILANPVCLIMFTLLSWRFFYKRIEFEDYTNLSYFGVEYQEYIKKTPILIPCIDSFLKKYRGV